VRPKSHYRNMNRKAAKVLRDLYYVGKIKQTELARMFGRSQGTVSKIISGQSWS
jgi:DNA-binding MarR family transcriptional regulator